MKNGPVAIKSLLLVASPLLVALLVLQDVGATAQPPQPLPSGRPSGHESVSSESARQPAGPGSDAEVSNVAARAEFAGTGGEAVEADFEGESGAIERAEGFESAEAVAGAAVMTPQQRLEFAELKPGDKPAGTMWLAAGPITKVEPRRLYYMIDTYPGQSGSCVWRLRSGQRTAVGIHAYGGCPNGATRITTEVFVNMKRWKDECK